MAPRLFVSCAVLSLVWVHGSYAQSAIVTVSSRRDQIALIKTAPGIATRVSFPEQVMEIICGDLYDSATGKGTFVVQRSGKDVFLKPVSPKGLTNLFVKTASSEAIVYSFDVTVVSANEAHRIVNVVNAQPSAPTVKRAFPPSTRMVEITPIPPGAVVLPVPDGLRLSDTPPPPFPVPSWTDSFTIHRSVRQPD